MSGLPADSFQHQDGLFDVFTFRAEFGNHFREVHSGESSVLDLRNEAVTKRRESSVVGYFDWRYNWTGRIEKWSVELACGC